MRCINDTNKKFLIITTVLLNIIRGLLVIYLGRKIEKYFVKLYEFSLCDVATFSRVSRQSVYRLSVYDIWIFSLLTPGLL